MDDQVGNILGEIYQLGSALFFLGFKYGLMAMTWLTTMVNSTMNDDAWLTKLLLTVLVILATLKALQIVYNGIMFWVRFALKFGIIVGSIMVAGWLWSRGIEGAYDDVTFLINFWSNQYVKYAQQAKQGQLVTDTLWKLRDGIVDQRVRAEQAAAPPPRGWF